jgi:hypothetical protein
MSGRSAKRRRREAAVHAAERPKQNGRVPRSSLRRDDRGARRRRQLLLSLGAALAVAAILIGIALARGGSGSAKFTGLKGKAEVVARFKGIPQQGLVLGRPKAPLTVEYFADPQCPVCRDFSVEALPTVVQQYVRPGKARLVFRGQKFLGSDSERMLRLGLAAARQNRLWQVMELGYLNQGSENSGWVSDPLLRAIAGAVPGLQAKRALADTRSAWVDSQMSRSEALFTSQTPGHTPYLRIGRSGSSLTGYDFEGLASLEATLNSLLQ